MAAPFATWPRCPSPPAFPVQVCNRIRPLVGSPAGSFLHDGAKSKIVDPARISAGHSRAAAAFLHPQCKTSSGCGSSLCSLLAPVACCKRCVFACSPLPAHRRCRPCLLPLPLLATAEKASTAPAAAENAAKTNIKKKPRQVECPFSANFFFLPRSTGGPASVSTPAEAAAAFPKGARKARAR